MSSSRYARSFAPKVSMLLALPLLALSGGAALADAIDGDWCHGDGRRLSINGPDIVTPGGARLKGDYDRHHFSYVVPASEPGAGGTVAMVLLIASKPCQRFVVEMGINFRRRLDRTVAQHLLRFVDRDLALA